MIAKPDYLNNIMLDQYKNQIEGLNLPNFHFIVEKVIQELKYPFSDPRKSRTPDEPHIDNERLFYLLIDETKRTFKRGIIVTATVNKVFDSLAMCKLDNGLKAIVHSSSILDERQQDTKLSEQLADDVLCDSVISSRDGDRQ